MATDVRPASGSVTAVDGAEVRIAGDGRLELMFDGQIVMLECLVLSKMLPNFNLVLGMDFVSQMGGVYVTGDRKVRFGRSTEVAEAGTRMALTTEAGPMFSSVEKRLVVEDVDFDADFDGSKWLVRWKWADEPGW